MRKGYRLKNLQKKFSYNALKLECAEQGWIIPTAHELGDSDIPYEGVWVTTIPVRKIDALTHSYTFRPISGNLIILNRNNLENAVVLVKEI